MNGIAGMIVAGVVALAVGLGASMLISTVYASRHSGRHGVEGLGARARPDAALEFARAYDELAILAAPGARGRARLIDGQGQQERLDEVVQQLARSAINLRLLCTEEASQVVEDAARICEPVVEALSGSPARAASRIDEVIAALKDYRPGLFTVLRAEIARS